MFVFFKTFEMALFKIVEYFYIKTTWNICMVYTKLAALPTHKISFTSAESKCSRHGEYMRKTKHQTTHHQLTAEQTPYLTTTTTINKIDEIIKTLCTQKKYQILLDLRKFLGTFAFAQVQSNQHAFDIDSLTIFHLRL